LSIDANQPKSIVEYPNANQKPTEANQKIYLEPR
jgi:hypothetical protein